MRKSVGEERVANEYGRAKINAERDSEVETTTDGVQ